MKRFAGITLFAAVISLLFFQLYCGRKAEVSAGTYASLDSTVKYAGMQECRQCHADIYNTYIRTGMGQSIDIARLEKSSAKFGQQPQVYDRYRDFYYKPYWDNDSLHFLEFRLDGKDTIYKRQETISFIIGSGQHTNSHIYSSGGYLYQAPLTYYTQKGKWDLPPGFENGHNTRFSRLIGLECLSCHNAYPEMAAGSENKFTSVPNGIDCERCHGPGSRHIAEKKAGHLVDVSSEIDYSIVNPAKLPVDLQLDVCQRCHIQGNAVLNEGKSFYDFKPGMRLADVMNVFMPVYKGGSDEHIMASHAERLRQSACFIGSSMTVSAKSHALKPYQNALTCVTCHDPHVSRLETPASKFNDACGRCHGGDKQGCTEDVHVLQAANFNCVKCHMPESGATDIPHVSVHDHKIRIPVAAQEKEKIREFAGIVSINNPKPRRQARVKAFINYFEKFGYDEAMLDSALSLLNERSELNSKENLTLLVHIYFLRKDYPKVVKAVSSVNNASALLNRSSYSNDDAWTCYRIGEAYKNTGNGTVAESWYRQCHALAPLEPRFANEFSEQLVLNGKTAEAIKTFQSIIAMEPSFAPAYSNLGYLFMTQGALEQASLMYEKALALDPDYGAALLNKAGLLLLEGQNKEAVSVLKRVLQLDPGNDKARLALEQIGAI